MATWKKVIVSGSTGNFANIQVDGLTSGNVVIGGGSGNLTTTAINGTGNIVATTNASGLTHSGSFSGSFQGNGAGLTGVTATATWPSTLLSPITGTTQVFVNDGTNKYTTVANFSSASWAGITGDVTINGSGVAAIGTGKVTSTMILDGTIVDADINASAAIAYTKLNLAGSSIVSASAQINGTAITNNTITIAGTSTALGGSISQATILAGSNVYSSSAQLPSGIVSSSGAGTSQGQFKLNGVDVNVNNLGTTGTPTFSSATITNDLTVNGNLAVNGTTTFVNTTNTYIKDQFVVINSGSSTLGDAGFVAQYNAAGSGSAFFVESTSAGTYGRWAVAYDVLGNVTAATADEFVVTVKANQASTPAAAPTWGGSSSGMGNMWTTNTGDIYIYA